MAIKRWKCSFISKKCLTNFSFHFFLFIFTSFSNIFQTRIFLQNRMCWTVKCTPRIILLDTSRMSATATCTSDLSKTSISYCQRETVCTLKQRDLLRECSDLLVLWNTEMFFDSSSSVILQYEWGLQMANEVTMPTDALNWIKKIKMRKKFSD